MERNYDMLKLIVQKMEIETEADNHDEGFHTSASLDDVISPACSKWNSDVLRKNLIRQNAVISKWKEHSQHSNLQSTFDCWIRGVHWMSRDVLSLMTRNSVQGVARRRRCQWCPWNFVSVSPISFWLKLVSDIGQLFGISCYYHRGLGCKYGMSPRGFVSSLSTVYVYGEKHCSVVWENSCTCNNQTKLFKEYVLLMFLLELYCNMNMLVTMNCFYSLHMIDNNARCKFQLKHLVWRMKQINRSITNIFLAACSL